jgi:uncharacterized protein (UPF0335 family)
VSGTVGKGTDAGRRLASFVERIERIREDRKALAADEKVVFAELRQSGFEPRVVRAVVKFRASEKAEREEFEALLATYLHALGMAEEPPLFRHFGLMTTDRLTREGALAALGAVLPEHGEIILRSGPGAAVRLRRGADGEPVIEDWHEAIGIAVDEEAGRASRSAPARSTEAGEGPARADTRKQALSKGRAAGRSGAAAMNPYPARSENHLAWQEGWRKGDAEPRAPAPAAAGRGESGVTP